MSKERDLKWAKEAAEKMAEEAETVEEVQEEAAEEAEEDLKNKIIQIAVENATFGGEIEEEIARGR